MLPLVTFIWLFYDAVPTNEDMESQLRYDRIIVNDELGEMWNGLWPILRHYPGISIE